MKLLGKLLIAVLFIGILLPFTILKGTDGRPLLSFADWKLPNIPKLPGDIQSASDDLPDNKDMIYEWTDAEGNIQFSNSPPPEGIEYIVKDYDPNLNVIQAVEVEAGESEEVVEDDSEEKVTGVDDIGNPYSLEKIEKLFEDANNVQKLLNQRLKDQEAIVGQ